MQGANKCPPSHHPAFQHKYTDTDTVLLPGAWLLTATVGSLQRLKIGWKSSFEEVGVDRPE